MRLGKDGGGVRGGAEKEVKELQIKGAREKKVRSKGEICSKP